MKKLAWSIIFISLIVVVSGLTEEQLMQAWQHPDEIKVVDEQLKEQI